jgi:hypothetical protein
MSCWLGLRRGRRKHAVPLRMTCTKFKRIEILYANCFEWTSMVRICVISKWPCNSEDRTEINERSNHVSCFYRTLFSRQATFSIGFIGDSQREKGYRSHYSGFDSRLEQGFLLFATASRPALGATQPPIEWVPGAISLEVKRPGREADHSPPSSAEVKECVELYLHSPNPSCSFGNWTLQRRWHDFPIMRSFYAIRWKLISAASLPFVYVH